MKPILFIAGILLVLLAVSIPSCIGTPESPAKLTVYSGGQIVRQWPRVCSALQSEEASITFTVCDTGQRAQVGGTWVLEWERK